MEHGVCMRERSDCWLTNDRFWQRWVLWMWAIIIKHAVRSWIVRSRSKLHTGEGPNRLTPALHVARVIAAARTPSQSQKKSKMTQHKDRCEAKTQHWLRPDEQCIPSFLEGGCLKLVVIWMSLGGFLSPKTKILWPVMSLDLGARLPAPGDQTSRLWVRSGEQEFTSSS